MSHTLWSKTTENLDGSTGPLAHPFARSLALLTHSLAPHCSLCSCATLCSFVHFPAHSLPSSWESDSMFHNALVLSHSAAGKKKNKRASEAANEPANERISWQVNKGAGK